MTALVVAIAIIAVPTAAWAKFTSAPSASLTVGTATVTPPTGFTDDGHCTYVNLFSRSMGLAWTASSYTGVTGYTLTVTTGNTTKTYSVSGRTTTSYTVTTSPYTSYSATLTAVTKNWSSTAATDSFSCGLFN